MGLLLTTTPSPLGRLVLLLEADGRLAGLGYDEAAAATGLAGTTAVATSDPRLAAPLAAVRDYLQGRTAELRLPLSEAASAGLTPFQRAVLDHLATVPAGQTRTYGEVAAAVGHPGAHRSVGSSLARNAVCLVRPCHRVVATGGGLGGYAGGLARKRWLLDLEAGLSPAPLAPG